MWDAFTFGLRLGWIIPAAMVGAVIGAFSLLALVALIYSIGKMLWKTFHAVLDAIRIPHFVVRWFEPLERKFDRLVVEPELSIRQYVFICCIPTLSAFVLGTVLHFVK